MREKVTCRICLQVEAVQSVAGERSSQYTCHGCGAVFEIDHPRKPFTTQARPQRISLPAIAGTSALPAAESQTARCRRILAALPTGLVVPASELQFDYNQATALATRQQPAQEQ